MRLFPDFDDNLRQAFRQETELFFESVLREDRSVLDLLKRRLHVPQRAAREALRHPARLRQPLPPRRAGRRTAQRGGLLRHGSILTVTSYATRTSPVIRGKWVLENLLGTPPPPPPPDVPALKDNTVSATLPVRERLAEHRSQRRLRELPQPDGPGRLRRWRTSTRSAAGATVEEGSRVDASGGLARRQQVRRRRRAGAGAAAAAGAVRRHADREAADVRARAAASSTTTRPAVRKIVREAQAAGLPLLVADPGHRRPARRFR